MSFSLFFFSLMHLLIRFVPNVPIPEIILYRSLFSLLISGAMIQRQGISFWGNRRGLLVLRGITGALSLMCFFYAIRYMPLAAAITVTNLMPFFALLLSVYFLKEKVSQLQWFFMALAFIGVYLVKGWDDRIEVLPLLAAIGGAVFTAGAHFLVRKLRDTEASDVIIFYFPLVSIPAMTIIMLVPGFGYEWYWPNAQDWVYLFFIGLFTHVGQLFLTKAYRHAEIGDLAPLYFLGILLALGYGYFLFQETYSWGAIGGMGLIVLGVALSFMNKAKT